jgi:hypothetical protein
MSDSTITDMLSSEEVPENIADLLEDLKEFLRDSRSHVGRYYDDWDAALASYARERTEDVDDRKAKAKGQPKKLSIPLTRAQVQTFVTFVLLLYTQNEFIFSYSPTGNEDYKLRDAINKLLHRETLSNNMFNKLLEFILDIARFNLGVLKTTWRDDELEVEVEASESAIESTESDFLTMVTEDSTSRHTVKLFEGNYVDNISPYNFFWDSSLPVSRFQEGMFAADETAYNIRQLKNWERQGIAHGVQYVQRMSSELHTKRKETRLPGFGRDFSQSSQQESKNFPVIVTTVYYRCAGEEYKLDNDDQERIWEIKIANDERIISIEKFGSVHNQFPYDAAELSPDQHGELSDSISSLIDPLQEVVTWLFNSRIASVRSNLQGRLIIDGRYVEVDDLKTGQPYIRAKKGAPLMGLDKFVHQLKTVDTTQGHMNDASEVIRMIQMVSGVNENAMGQFHGGRRSATEARAVSMGSSARMKLYASSIWSAALVPFARKMLINLRQFLSQEKFQQILGDSEEFGILYSQFHPTPSWKLAESEDFFVEDSTTATEKGYVAQSLQELLLGVISNPMVMQVMPLDLKEMMKEIQSLRGVKDLSRFFLQTPEQQQQLQNGLNQINAGPAQQPGDTGGGI